METIVGYEAPVVEVLEVGVEKGFCGSVTPTLEDWGNGGSINQ